MSNAVLQFNAAIDELCLALPETSRVISHGSPNFRVKGKTFASLAINHHGDQRVALWLAAPDGAQAHWLKLSDVHYFRPPYVGPKGWLGVNLDQGLSWAQIGDHVFEAWRCIAPVRLDGSRDMLPDVRKWRVDVRLETLEPMLAKPVQARVREVASMIEHWPEVVAADQFGAPAWKAGKKTFCVLHMWKGRLQLQCWVGADLQSTLLDTPGFSLPAFSGHQGWIGMDIGGRYSKLQARELLEMSYRHFALKRMLNQFVSD